MLYFDPILEQAWCQTNCSILFSHGWRHHNSYGRVAKFRCAQAFFTIDQSFQPGLPNTPITLPASSDSTNSKFVPLQTPVASAPKWRVASYTANVPTAPDAPQIRTFYPGWIFPLCRHGFSPRLLSKLERLTLNLSNTHVCQGLQGDLR